VDAVHTAFTCNHAHLAAKLFHFTTHPLTRGCAVKMQSTLEFFVALGSLWDKNISIKFILINKTSRKYQGLECSNSKLKILRPSLKLQSVLSELHAV
jgi:hypothetical protein